MVQSHIYVSRFEPYGGWENKNYKRQNKKKRLKIWTKK